MTSGTASGESRRLLFGFIRRNTFSQTDSSDADHGSLFVSQGSHRVCKRKERHWKPTTQNCFELFAFFFAYLPLSLQQCSPLKQEFVTIITGMGGIEIQIWRANRYVLRSYFLSKRFHWDRSHDRVHGNNAAVWMFLKRSDTRLLIWVISSFSFISCTILTVNGLLVCARMSLLEGIVSRLEVCVVTQLSIQYRSRCSVLDSMHELRSSVWLKIDVKKGET